MLEKWRNWLAQNNALATVLAVVVMICALGAIVIQLRGPRRPSGDRKAWFYDLGTGKLLIRGIEAIPPIETEAGNYAVKAFVFACGECPKLSEGMTKEEVEKAGAFIGYFESFTIQSRDYQQAMIDQAKKQSGGKGGPGAGVLMMGEMKMMDPGYKISDLQALESADDPTDIDDDDVWFQGMTPTARDIQRAIHDKCPDGKSPKWCSPYR